MPLDGYLSTLPSDVLLNPGVLFVGASKVGVTRGGITFDPGHEYENVEFDGKQAPLKGLDRKYNGEPKITGTLIEFADSTTGNQIAKLEVNSSSASAGSPNVTTITPAAGGSFISTYQSDVRIIWDRGLGSGTKRYLALYLPVGFFLKYTVKGGATRAEAEIEFEIVGRKDMASGTVADAAYKIEQREALPS